MQTNGNIQDETQVDIQKDTSESTSPLNNSQKRKKKFSVLILQITLASVALLVFLLIISWFVMGAHSRRNPPQELGLNLDGKLRPCPASPNCVCSQWSVDEPIHNIDPITPANSRSVEATWKTLIDVLHAMPDVNILTEEASYVHATFNVSIFGFIDDVELSLDQEAQRIHIRSASRVGHSDLGYNRRRVEKLRAAISSHAAQMQS